MSRPLHLIPLFLCIACKPEPVKEAEPEDTGELADIELPDIELPDPLPFEECPPVDRLSTLSSDDLQISGSSASVSGTYLTCGTWGMEEEAQACYTDTNEVVVSVQETVLDLALSLVGGLLDVECDSNVEVVCGPLPPEAVAALYEDGRFRCCFNVELQATCSL
jgi:hypothetical protein